MTWTTKTELYPHQARAVAKLRRSRVGALFMDMGTGKTRCAIEFARLRQRRIDRVLWFCPVSLKETVAEEIRKHTACPPSAIYLFDGATTLRTLPLDALWYIVGIESMSSSDRMVLAAHRLITTRSFVIVDESSYIKGHASLRTRRITLLGKKARYRMILTGTPLSQGVVDLYAQMRFLSPQILGYGSFYAFAANHLEYSDKYPGLILRAHHTGWLAAKISPYTYQVTKGECLDLPEKLFDVRYFNLTPAQQAAYSQAKYDILLSIETVDDFDSYVIFRLFTALQKIVSGYDRDETGALVEYPHHRLAQLAGVIADLPPQDKVIVWCKYRYSVAQIIAHLTAAHGPDAVAAYYGDLDEAARHAQLERFRSGARFLVATMATGGHGLNLTEARYAIFYENGFKYAERLQAEDRIHRIGQTQPVTYIDLVSHSGIERRIQDALASKGNVVAAFKRQIDAMKDSSRGELRKLVATL